jgi:hypothetical protein
MLHPPPGYHEGAIGPAARGAHSEPLARRMCYFGRTP